MLLPTFGGFGWDPFAEMRRMQEEMNRLFSEFDRDVGQGVTAAQSFPPVNVWTGEDSLVITTMLPGVPANDVDLSVREDTLTIRGRRTPPTEGDSVAWHRRERGYGGFARTIDLPFRVDADKAKARFNHGVLEVELPRHESDRARKIAISAA